MALTPAQQKAKRQELELRSKVLSATVAKQQAIEAEKAAKDKLKDHKTTTK